MGLNLDDLTWSCHVCGDERPDRLISVFSRMVNLSAGIVVQENVRYCNDRAACAAGAQQKHFINPEKHMTKSNGKYIVFKVDEFHEMMGELALPPGSGAPTDTDCASLAERILTRSKEVALDDAVVIRRQDIFAGPALQTYASSIALTAHLLEQFGTTESAKQLQHVADYFHEQAEIALDTIGKLPD